MIHAERDQVCRRPARRWRTRTPRSAEQQPEIHRFRAAHASPAIAMPNGLPERGGSVTISVEPNGASPNAAGLSGSISSTNGHQRQDHRRHHHRHDAPAVRLHQARQQRQETPAARWHCWRSAARSPGRAAARTSGWRSPSPARPSRAPVPRPTSTPQVRYSCQISVTNVLSPAPATSSDHRHQSTVRFSPIVWIIPVGERPDQPEQQDVQRNRAGDRRRIPAERLLQRHDQHARRRTHPDSRAGSPRTSPPRRPTHSAGAQQQGGPLIEVQTMSPDAGPMPQTRILKCAFTMTFVI